MAMNENFSCGKRIKELRLERAMSQEKLALNAGITPAYLGLVERGKRNVTVAIVERLCVAMNISLAEFFAEDRCGQMCEDPTGIQIMCELSALTEEEKVAVLSIVRASLSLRQVGIHMFEEKENHATA